MVALTSSETLDELPDHPKLQCPHLQTGGGTSPTSQDRGGETQWDMENTQHTVGTQPFDSCLEIVWSAEAGGQY